jgi:hypothetical protein
MTGILAICRTCPMMLVVETEEGAIAQLSLHELEDDHANRSRFT